MKSKFNKTSSTFLNSDSHNHESKAHLLELNMNGKQRIDVKVILKIIEKDMERKMSPKQKLKLKLHKDITNALMGNESRGIMPFQQQDQLKQLQGHNKTQKLFFQHRLSHQQSQKQLENHDPFRIKVLEVDDIQQSELQKHNQKIMNRAKSSALLSDKSSSKVSAAKINSFLMLQQKISDIQQAQKKMRESVKLEINKRELTNPIGYVQKRISNFIRNDDPEDKQNKHEIEVKRLQQQPINEPKTGKFTLLPFHQSDQAEFRHVNMLFSKKEEDHIKSMKNYQNQLQGGIAEVRRAKHQLIDKKNFDYNKYHVISPFNRTRNSNELSLSRNYSCMIPQTQLDTNNTLKDKEQIDKILKGCNRYHNQLASFCKFQGKKIQRRFETLEENHSSILRQIDVARDLLFMDLCKRNKIRQKFRDLVNSSLQEDWQKLGEDLQERYENELLKKHCKKFSEKQLSNRQLRDELLQQIQVKELEMQKKQDESLAENDSFMI